MGPTAPITLTSGVLTRTYPLASVPTHPAPRPWLVIDLHWYTGTAAAAEQQHLFDAKAAATGAIVAYPQGIGNRWNAGGCCGLTPETTADDVAFITTVINDVLARYPVDPSKIAIGGYSNGGGMAIRYACERSDMVNAVFIGPATSCLPPATSRSRLPSSKCTVWLTRRCRGPDSPSHQASPRWRYPRCERARRVRRHGWLHRLDEVHARRRRGAVHRELHAAGRRRLVVHVSHHGSPVADERRGLPDLRPGEHRTHVVFPVDAIPLAGRLDQRRRINASASSTARTDGTSATVMPLLSDNVTSTGPSTGLFTSSHTAAATSSTAATASRLRRIRRACRNRCRSRPLPHLDALTRPTACGVTGGGRQCGSWSSRLGSPRTGRKAAA